MFKRCNYFSCFYFYRGEQNEKLATWSRLENAMFKRSGHAMAPIILSDTKNTKKIKQIVMFGGNIDPITSPHYDGNCQDACYKR